MINYVRLLEVDSGVVLIIESAVRVVFWRADDVEGKKGRRTFMFVRLGDFNGKKQMKTFKGRVFLALFSLGFDLPQQVVLLLLSLLFITFVRLVCF